MSGIFDVKYNFDQYDLFLSRFWQFSNSYMRSELKLFSKCFFFHKIFWFVILKNKTIKIMFFSITSMRSLQIFHNHYVSFLNNSYNLDLVKSSHLDSLTFYTDTTNLLTWASHWTDSVQLSVIKISWLGRTTTQDHLISRRNCHIGLESDVTHWIWTMYRKYHGAGIRTKSHICSSQSRTSSDRTCPVGRGLTVMKCWRHYARISCWKISSYRKVHRSRRHCSRLTCLTLMCVELWTRLSVDWRVKVLLWPRVSGC